MGLFKRTKTFKQNEVKDAARAYFELSDHIAQSHENGRASVASGWLRVTFAQAEEALAANREAMENLIDGYVTQNNPQATVKSDRD